MKKILVNPNGADIDLFSPATKTDRKQAILKEKLTIPADAYLFGYISTFSFWHGIELLTDLIPQVIKTNQKVHFLLIGDGMLKNNIEAHLLKLNLESYVTFTGMVDLTTARNYLALCDAFLCPTQPHKDGSRSFYSPIKLFEYMSLAKPILASDLEQQQEILNPALHLNNLKNNNDITDECGILLDPQSIQAWYDAIIFLLSFSKKNHGSLGNNARNKILSHYTWDHHIQRIKIFIES